MVKVGKSMDCFCKHTGNKRASSKVSDYGITVGDIRAGFDCKCKVGKSRRFIKQIMLTRHK